MSQQFNDFFGRVNIYEYILTFIEQRSFKFLKIRKLFIFIINLNVYQFLIINPPLKVSIQLHKLNHKF